MNLQKAYTVFLTAELAAAEGWYTKLLGRGPDYRPMDTMVQWELYGRGGIALSTDVEIAGNGVMSLSSMMSRPSAAGCRAWGLCLGTTFRATTRRWRRCVIPTATCSHWQRRPPGPIRPRDRAGRREPAFLERGPSLTLVTFTRC